jgi:N-acetylmuramoyl-L-alanine amidase
MPFDAERYPIVPRLLTAPSKRRSGRALAAPVRFVVAHDTGNPGSTAAGNVAYYERSRNEVSASAHLFVDDRQIIECIPALTGTPEKAWHVLYGVTADNATYGADANDAAIGVEYCYGGAIDADEAYRRYVWVLAALCVRFALDPSRDVTGHCFLDPKRKTDPVTGLLQSRRSWDQLLVDIAAEVSGHPPVPAEPHDEDVVAVARLNVRDGRPSTLAPVRRVVNAGTRLRVVQRSQGDRVAGNALWYRVGERDWVWSGAVRAGNVA